MFHRLVVIGRHFKLKLWVGMPPCRKKNIQRECTARETSRVVERAGTIRMEFFTYTLH
ncbi:hypothetical protein WUBG_16398, partial [Wuchereria bancrofti]